VGLSPNTLESVVSFDGQSGFWISSAPVQTLYGASPSPIPAGPSSGTGIRYFVPGPGVNTSTPLYNAFPVKALTLFNNQLWAAKLATGLAGDQPYVWGRIGPASGAPTNATAAASTSFATYGMTLVQQACQMVFQDAFNVWSVGCGALVGTGASATVQQGGLFWSTSGLPTWFTTSYGVPPNSNETAFRAIAATTINGAFTLFVVGEPYNVNPLNVSNRVWSFNSLQHSWSTSPIAVSPIGTLFKGIAPAPYSPQLNPSITPTAPVTPSLTPAATSSPLPCNVAISLGSGYPGSISNDTSTYGFSLLPAGSQCLSGSTAISTGSSPQQYFVWQVRRQAE
jgi:hypothetical protein